MNSSLRTKVPGYVIELINGKDSPDDNRMKDSQAALESSRPALHFTLRPLPTFSSLPLSPYVREMGIVRVCVSQDCSEKIK